jgi:hypothetical protein
MALRSSSHGVRGSETGLRKFIRFAGDVVTVRGVRSGGAQEARFLCITNTKKARRQDPFPRRQAMADIRNISSTTHYGRPVRGTPPL